MNGKTLRNMHRTAMRRDGGLVQGKEGYEKTNKYLSLKEWLREQGNKKLQQAIGEWKERKRLQRKVRRIRGPREKVKLGYGRRFQKRA